MGLSPQTLAMANKYTDDKNKKNDAQLADISVKANDWNDFKNGGGDVNGDVKARNFYAHYFHHKMLGLDIGDWEAAGLGVINSDVSKVIQASVGRYDGVYTLYPDAKHNNVFQPMDLGHKVAPWRDLWLGKHRKGRNGYCSLPNGMLVQWGYIGGGTSITVTFPIAWSATSSYSFVAIPYFVFESDLAGLSWKSNRSSENQINLHSTKSHAYFWIAIGW